MARHLSTPLTSPVARRRELARHLAERIVREQTAVWSDPHVPGVRQALARRGQCFALAMRMQWDMINLMRMLLAVNHRWDIDWKWIDDRHLDLPVAPHDLARRINDVFRMDELEAGVRREQLLILEALEMIPPPHDVSRPIANFRSALELPA